MGEPFKGVNSLVTEARAGGYSWYRLSDRLAGADGALAPLHAWLAHEFMRSSPETRADDARLAQAAIHVNFNDQRFLPAPLHLVARCNLQQRIQYRSAEERRGAGRQLEAAAGEGVFAAVRVDDAGEREL